MRKLLVLCALLLPVKDLHPSKVSPYVWYDRAELRCLVDNVYNEARSEPFYGQALVARVTLNRAAKMSKSICKTVYQPYQFSWTIKKPKTARNSAAYAVAWHAAYYAQTINLPNIFYYHTKAVKPYWSKKFPRQFTYGAHIFYSS